jgi:hypothetical protein
VIVDDPLILGSHQTAVQLPQIESAFARGQCNQGTIRNGKGGSQGDSFRWRFKEVILIFLNIMDLRGSKWVKICISNGFGM